MPRTALIVDDSRTALVALSRLLKVQGLVVDTVESGPEALDYLHHNASPGVIFLDHMMPGMDGFETLKALKADAQTATIPVIMYTSREGESYIGQALVQGALGVLSKPVNPDRLTEILQQVDRLRGMPTAGGDRRARPRAMHTGVFELPTELRPSAVPTRERQSPSVESERPARLPTVNPRHVRARWPGVVGYGLLVVLLLSPAVWYYQRLQLAERQRSELAQDNARLRVELEQQRERVAAAEAKPQPPAKPETMATRVPPETQALHDSLAWALNQAGHYGPDDVPFNDTRLTMLRELLARLTVSGFRGSVRLESHVGEFCLARNAQGEYSLPHDSLSFQACEVVTHPPAQAVMLGQRQSAAFARFLAERRNAAIRVSVMSHGSSQPLVPYPDATGPLTAGEWNRAARHNQRVEISLVPAPSEN